MTRVNKFDFAFFRRRESLWVLLLFMLLTAFAARNVLADLDGVIIGNDNDVYINPWADWWTVKALTDPDVSFWHSDFMYYPIGADLVYHSFSHLNTAVSVGLRPFVGTLPAYNITILLNFILAGLSMFHLGRYMTGSSAAGIVAGIVFTFNSHNLYQSAHPVLISIWCFPWMTLYFIRAIRENNLKLALAASVFVFLGAATSTLLLVLSILWISLLVIFMFFSSQFPRPPLKIVLVFGVMSGAFVFPTVYWLIRDAIVNSNNNFIIETSISIPTDLFSPFMPHWQKYLIRRGLYIGIMPLFLMMVAFGRQRKSATLWFVLTIFAYLFAIGPEPEFLGRSLGITLPWSLLVMPVLRHGHRIMILMSMGVAMLAAYGWLGMMKSFSNQSSRIKLLIMLVVCVAIYGEYTAVAFPNTPINISAFYSEFLEDVPTDVAIATLPIGRQEDKRYMFYQSIHEHPMTGGVISRAGNDIFAFINDNSLLAAGKATNTSPLPENPEAELQKLAQANVGYLIIDKTLIENVALWLNYFPIEPVFEDEFLVAYSTGLLNE